MRTKIGYFLFATIFTAAILGGWLGDQVSAGSGSETEQLLRTFTETLAVVQSNYVREVDSEELVESSIRGMLRTLDPHSSFFSHSDYSRLQEEQQGKYYGLGISIRAEAPGSGRVVVVEPPAPGTPAYKAGLHAGDIIFKVNGELIEDWDINDEVIPNLKGPRGTTVNITVERPGETQALDFTVERDEIPLYTIKFAFQVRPGIGYIRIDKFSETTGDELDHALEEVDEPHLQGLILDLRDNPGGSLGAALAVADRFLSRGQLIVSTRSRGGVADRAYKAQRGSKGNYPMVVLINQNSASASEIVSGALQDHDRALIVGETSFGKALVQTIYPLEGNRGLALTTGKYYTPSDRLIQRDYSDGFYNYFYSRHASKRSDDKHETDSGRPVYSGGGITPDEEVAQRPYSRLAREIDRRNLFYKFARQLMTDTVHSDVRYDYTPEAISKLDAKHRQELMDRLVISDATLNLFKDFLSKQDKEIRFGDSFDENVELIRNRIRQELFLAMFGEKDGYRIALELDTQLRRAIELLPKAAALHENIKVASKATKP